MAQEKRKSSRPPPGYIAVLTGHKFEVSKEEDKQEK
jgi:hypothetical protein